MESTLLRQRRNLILISAAIVGLELVGADLSRVSLIGLNFDSSAVKRPEMLYYMIWVAWFWFFIRYLQYVNFESENDIADYKTRWLAALMLDQPDSQYCYSELVKTAMKKLSESGRFGNSSETYEQIKLCLEELPSEAYPDSDKERKYRAYFVERINEDNELAESDILLDKQQYRDLRLRSWYLAFVRSPMGTDYYAPMFIGILPLIAACINAGV